MNILSGLLNDAQMAWFHLTSTVNCCASPSNEETPLRGEEKHMRIEHFQPRLVPPPMFEPQGRRSARSVVARSRESAARALRRGSFSVRRRLFKYTGGSGGSSSRRPRIGRIGSPSDFRHVEQGAAPRTQQRFRPLELSIYLEHRLSPLLPHIIEDEEPPLAHSRSESALSYQIPRKPVLSYEFKTRPRSMSTSELLETLKGLPQIPQPARLRSSSEAPVYERVKSALHEQYELEQKLREVEETIEKRQSIYPVYERVKSALNERHELEQKLKDIEDTIVERQSIYMNSRPTSRATMTSRQSMNRPSSIYSESQEPMPPAPSFAERVASPLSRNPSNTSSLTRTIISRSNTASPSFISSPLSRPSTGVSIPKRMTPYSTASQKFARAPPLLKERHPLPPPPLPLVLTPPPPLRRRKSFSRVSSWLFPSSPNPSNSNEHGRTMSLDSITNTPKPITSRDGFYQCIDLKSGGRQSSDSINSAVSPVSSMGSLDDGATEPTTAWSSPSRGDRLEREREREREREMEVKVEMIDLSTLEGMMPFGEKEVEDRWGSMAVGHGRDSVGVAF